MGWLSFTSYLTANETARFPIAVEAGDSAPPHPLNSSNTGRIRSSASRRFASELA